MCCYFYRKKACTLGPILATTYDNSRNISTQECKTIWNVKVEKQTLDAAIYPELSRSYTSFPLVLVVVALHI